MSKQMQKASSSQRRANKKAKKRSKVMGELNVPAIGSGKFSYDSGRVVAPAASTRLIRMPGLPNITPLPGGDGRTRVRHREYIRDVNGSDIFECTAFDINPGLDHIFPWLSAMANNYESYVFKRLVFIYETQQSTSVAGTVMMAVTFDADDDLPENKQMLMAYKGAVRGSPWAEFAYDSTSLDLRKFASQRYVRAGPLGEDQDKKTYDVGRMFLGSQAVTDNLLIGELYVMYDIELVTPVGSISTVPSASNLYRMRVLTGAYSSASWYTSGTYTDDGSLPIDFDGNTITFRVPGRYTLGWSQEFTSTAGMFSVNALPSGMTWVQTPEAGLAADAESCYMWGVLEVVILGTLTTSSGAATGTSERVIEITLGDYNPSALLSELKKDKSVSRRRLREKGAGPSARPWMTDCGVEVHRSCIRQPDKPATPDTITVTSISSSDVEGKQECCSGVQSVISGRLAPEGGVLFGFPHRCKSGTSAEIAGGVADPPGNRRMVRTNSSGLRTETYPRE